MPYHEPLKEPIDPATLNYVLPPDPNPPTERYADSVPDKEKRLRASAAGRAWLADHWGEPHDGRDGFNWHDHGHSVDYAVLAQVFAFDELTRIWVGQAIMSRISDHFEEHHQLLEKVRHSVWHHCYAPGAYDAVAAAMGGLQKINWPGATIKIVYVSKYREDGYAENLRGENLWIDNDIGLLVYVDGKHVLTVGLGFGKNALFLAQVQLRQKKGNRWLFKLGVHYLDVAVAELEKAFAMPIWIIDGKSAVEAVRRSYGSSECKITAEVEERVVNLYDRPIAGYERGTEVRRHYGREYRELVRSR